MSGFENEAPEGATYLEFWRTRFRDLRVSRDYGVIA